MPSPIQNSPSAVARWCVGIESGSVEEHLQADIQALMKTYGARVGQHLPVNLEVLAGLLGCTLQFANMSMRADGLLVPISNGFAIRINAARPATRQRFTIAHELSHTLFYDRTPEIPVRVADRISHEAEEALCDGGAQEILMPRCLLNQAKLLELGATPPRRIVSASMGFQVSTEVAARRLKNYDPELSDLGVCEWVTEERYVRYRSVNFSISEQYDPLVLKWLVPIDVMEINSAPRGTRLRQGTALWPFFAGSGANPEGTEVQVGHKLYARLKDTLILSRKDRRTGILATFDSLRHGKST